MLNFVVSFTVASFRAVLSLVEVENWTKPYFFQDIAVDTGSIFLSLELATIKVTKNMARPSKMY